MNIIEFYNSLNIIDPKEAIERFLLFYSSLVIVGIKPSVTVAIKKNNPNFYKSWLKYGNKFLNKLNLEFIILRESNNSIILLIFDREILNKYLFKKRNIKFLKKIGYRENRDLDYYLRKLKNRYHQYNCPHELGIFLGIPVEDVIDFIENNKKCLGVGYWKIYNNYDKAIEIFKKYDEVRNKTINYLMKGLPLERIIRNISVL
ncbi:DUF3793 family protein [Clostridium isatidis]|uniref:DUF3793 domain-containing protein n=1 Tax=Clostridium isatidis TaxID=182773 RepID=A0A343JF35_9CLOT|nr:DUF3793 family protein [Clostridium isatidis]ASW44143.1 hypothetical protein BEN51_11945 [Clostridium isatidis]